MVTRLGWPTTPPILNIDRHRVQLDEPIKTVGTHLVTVEVSPGVTATIKTMVVAA